MSETSLSSPHTVETPRRGSDEASRQGRNITVHDLQTYINFKSFDVIGNGSYRKHVNAAKERGESWAVKMLESVAEVNAATKAIQHLVSDLQAANKTGLHVLCQTVIENNTPPIEQNTVMSECSVSGKQKCQCIVLKCKGRGAPCIMVQSRFGHFVLMLWTVFKMDLVIKTVTRDFIDQLENGDDMSMRELCEEFMKESENMAKLSNAIVHAVAHVRQSLHNALMS